MLKIRKKPRLLTIAIIFVVIMGFVVYHNKLGYANQPITLTADVTVEIKEGAASTAISKALYEKGLTRGVNDFKNYSKREGIATQLKPGTYTFSGEVSLASIADVLVKGQTNEVKITIPEGLTVKQTAAKIKEQYSALDVDKFVAYTVNGDFPYDYLPAKGKQERLEGFLFPNTYFIEKDWTEQQIVDLLLAQFDKEFKQEWRTEAGKMKMSIFQVVTLASIIEREAQLDKDRPLVSSVFHNRLDHGIKLDSCATIQYILGVAKPVLSYDDLKIKSPYNTYQNQGLPPGPIANPGAASIEAALYPAHTDYYYFVLNPADGSHVFSKTLAEHNENVKKYLK